MWRHVIKDTSRLESVPTFWDKAFPRYILQMIIKSSDKMWGLWCWEIKFESQTTV